MSRPGKLPVVVVYRKSTRKNSKPVLEVFEDVVVDDIINQRKKIQLIPDTCEILEIGMGESFIQRYKEKYKI